HRHHHTTRGGKSQNTDNIHIACQTVRCRKSFPKLVLELKEAGNEYQRPGKDVRIERRQVPTRRDSILLMSQKSKRRIKIEIIECIPRQRNSSAEKQNDTRSLKTSSQLHRSTTKGFQETGDYADRCQSASHRFLQVPVAANHDTDRTSHCVLHRGICNHALPESHHA